MTIIGNKLRNERMKKRVWQMVYERQEEISPYDANRNSFEIITTLVPTADTLPVARAFFSQKFLPDFSAGMTRVLKKEDKERQFYNLICSLYFASNTRPLRVTRNSNFYINHPKLSQFIIKVVNWLIENGYCHFLPGTYFKRKGGRRWTRLAPSKKLKFELLNKITVRSDADAALGSELIKLRKNKELGDKKKEDIPIPPNKKKLAKRLQEEVRAINRCNSAHTVTLPNGKKQISIICDLHRVYNNSSFNDNGRFYNGAIGYQSLPQEERAKLLIDGNATVELDFDAYHPTLLYCMKGVQYVGDPYTKVTSDKRLRPILKKLLLALFNTPDYTLAVRAGNYTILNDEPELWQILKGTNATIKQLVEMFKEAHQPIAEYFASSQGYTLTNIDSQIALLVLEHFTSKREACLCIHDSFIVERRLEGELKKVMEESYQYIAKKISPDNGFYTCNVSKK